MAGYPSQVRTGYAIEGGTPLLWLDILVRLGLGLGLGMTVQDCIVSDSLHSQGSARVLC